MTSRCWPCVVKGNANVIREEWWVHDGSGHSLAHHPDAGSPVTG